MVEAATESAYRTGGAPMRCTDGLMAILSFSGETVLLCLAVALALLFLAVLVLDRLKHGKRKRRRLHGSGGRRETSGNFVSNMRLLQGELKKMLQERSQRKYRHGRRRHPRRTPQ